MLRSRFFTAEQVEAITFLLASAVDGLTTENVSVLDDAGRVLSAATEPTRRPPASP